MKRTKKIVTLALAAMLLVSSTVAVTMAYLTSTTEVAKNTFTVGNVKITLDEYDYDNDDNTDDNVKITVDGKEEVRDTANEYHLLPGQTYVKDPTVTIVEGSEESYVRMLVKVNNYSNLKAAFRQELYQEFYNGDVFLLQKLVTGWDENTWISTKVVSVVDDVATYEFRYKEPVAGPAENNDKTIDGTRLPALFEEIVIPGTINNTDLANLKNVVIDVEAHAIQKAGFENNEAAAWESFIQ